MQQTSVIIRVKAVDEDGEKLKYKLYVGKNKENLEEITIKEADQGEEIDLIATGIDTDVDLCNKEALRHVFGDNCGCCRGDGKVFCRTHQTDEDHAQCREGEWNPHMVE